MSRHSSSVSVARATAPVLLLAALTGCSVTGGGSDSADAKEGPSFTVAAAGDVLIHPQLTEQGRKDAAAGGDKTGKKIDFHALMAGVKPVISKADLAICHFEPVAGKPQGPFEGFPDFIVPPQITTALKDVGYDTCSTASNHTLDHGASGVRNTLDALDGAGLKHTGSARSSAEAAKPLIMDVKGVKVAQLSYAFGFNGRKVPADKPWLTNETDFKRIAAAEKAARKAGAEVVILSIHWGREHHPDPSNGQLKLARRLARETGINLVIGHHAHVVQPMEKIGNTWIAYGLGNQVARHDVPSGLTEEGVIGWFEFHKRGDTWDVDARYVPTLLTIPPDADGNGTQDPDAAVKDHRLVDLATSLEDADKLPATERARYRMAFERTQGTLLNRGAVKDGLKPLKGLPE
ncbi:MULTISPECIES: CapA family protein [unclassified Streptomyces]|uniref:CapA family protein n=1 Tax=unclassified Streptomyces TaxID=2593676 RepID=UPI002E770B86|nr:CapA family protein [Streptomyces sp. JV190]MEE1842825.1 CapA family protein [Streptomyces sp. JV190]